MNGREISRQTSAKQTNAQTQAWQPNKQMAEGAGRFSLSILSEISQTEYVRQRQNSKKKF